MTDTPIVPANDIDAILAKADAYAFGKDHDAARILTLDHVPNMAREIMALRARLEEARAMRNDLIRRLGGQNVGE